MSIHTILSQEIEAFDKKLKNKGIGGLARIIIKDLVKSFATRIVEEVGKELIGSDDDIKILIAPMFKTMAKIRNQLRQEQRTKLQKMKGEV